MTPPDVPRCPTCGQPDPGPDPVLWTMTEVARILDRPRRTVEKWRDTWRPGWAREHPQGTACYGPEPLEVEGYGIRYEPETVLDWQRAHRLSALVQAAKARNAADRGRGGRR